MWSARSISGRASTTIVVSTAVISTPVITTPSAKPGPRRRIGAVYGGPTAAPAAASEGPRRARRPE